MLSMNYSQQQGNRVKESGVIIYSIVIVWSGELATPTLHFSLFFSPHHNKIEVVECLQ